MDTKLKVIDEEKVEDLQEEEEKEKLTDEELFMRSYKLETKDNIMSKRNYIERLEKQVKKCEFEIKILKKMDMYKDIMKELYKEKNGCGEKIKYNKRLLTFYDNVLRHLNIGSVESRENRKN